MANQTIFGNGIKILNTAFELAQLASDPSGSNGMMYYNTVSNKIRQYANGAWLDIASGSVSLTGQTLNQNNIIVGNGSNVSAAVDTSATGDILVDSSGGANIKSGVIVNADVNASAAIAYSKLALSGSIVNTDVNASAAIAVTKLAAVTASRALASDGSGFITPSSVTATELGYLTGATSNIQAQITAATSTIQNFEWQPSVIDRIVTPPGSPTVGDRYLIDTTVGSPTGAWVGNGNSIAQWSGSVWLYTVPTAGTFVSVDAEADGLYLFGGSSWAKKYFEATTASTGLVKVGFDIRLDATSAGAGLGFSSGVLAVNVDDSTVEIATDTLRVKDAGITSAKLSAAVAGNGITGGAGSALSVNHDGEGLIFASTLLALELDGSTLSKSATGVKVAAGGITNTEVNASAAIALSKLAAVTASRALVSDGSGFVSASSVTSTELGYVAGVTSAIQTQLGSKADLQLSNLSGTTAVPVNLLPSTTATKDLGTSSVLWRDLYIGSIQHTAASQFEIRNQGTNSGIMLRADGTGNIDTNATAFRRSSNGTNFVEERYYDALTLAANTSAATEISSTLSFALASYDVAHIDYRVKEATTNSVRGGRLTIVTDGTNAYCSDSYTETAVVGNTSLNGIKFSVDVSSGNVRILFVDTHASNACTMRVDRKLFRV